MRKWRWLMVLGFASITSLGLRLAWSLQAQPKNAPPMEQRPSVVQVSALGRLEPQGEMITLAAPTSTEGARVEQLFVKEGDLVQPQQVLAVLDIYARRESAVQEAQTRVEVAQAKLAQIKAGAKISEVAAQEAMVARAETELHKAEEDFNRAAELRAKRTITHEEYDARKQQREAATQTLRHAREMLTSIREVRTVDIKLAEAEVRTVEAGVKRAQAELAAAQVRALGAGRVLKIHARPGERIGDQGLLQMGQTETMMAVAEVYETDISRIRVGQTVRVRLAGVEGELAGVVDRIGLQVGRKNVLNNDPVADTDARVVEVWIKLSRSASPKIAGLSNARVDVVIEVK